jgi:hypothetical protein
MESCPKRVTRAAETRQSKEMMRRICEISALPGGRFETRFFLRFARLEMPNLHIKPAPPLSRFVEMLWYYEQPPLTHHKERLMPDGCISMVINLEQDETRIYDADDLNRVTKLGGCSIVGPHTKCFAIAGRRNS